MLDIRNKKITVLGAQRSGLAACKLIQAHGGNARISDLNQISNCPEKILHWIENNNIDAEFGGHTQDFITDSDLIVVSPGVPIFSEPVNWARENGIPYLGEIEFASQYCNKPIIAVTGSNGKTTVVNLINNILTQAGKNICLCGNVGFPFSEFVLNPVNVDYFVLEVSSFQMESLLGSKFGSRETGQFQFKKFKPYIAVLLNISENHLDRHKDMDEYVSSKWNIFLNQDKNDFSILNKSDKTSQQLRKSVNSSILEFDEQGSFNPNYDAAALVGEILKVDRKNIDYVLDEFKGVEHRMELVCSVDGVDYINDSKSTTPKASQWALNRLDKSVVWICGGRDKNLDFNICSELVSSKVKCIIAIGEARQKIKETFKGRTKIFEAGSFEDAVKMAAAHSKTGDCVLLSPMCASFDMFKNFEERGHAFKEIVMNMHGGSVNA